MDAIDLLRYQVRDTYAWLEMTVSDVSEEQANWRPPGIANSIGATYAHIMITADEDFNALLYGGETRIAGYSAGRIGLSELPPEWFGWDWHDWASRVRVNWAAFRRYAREVEACIEDRLGSLSAVDLERGVDMTAFGEHLGTWTGFEFYNLHGIDHPRLHGGEIACLKGLQGSPAWRQGWKSEIERPL